MWWRWCSRGSGKEVGPLRDGQAIVLRYSSYCEKLDFPRTSQGPSGENEAQKRQQSSE